MIHRRIAESKQQDDVPNPGGSANIPMEQITREVNQWLSNQSNHTWLLIVDNLDRDVTDEGGYDILPYLPQRDHGSVLITSHLAPIARLGRGIKIGRMSATEASSLLGDYIKSVHQEVPAASTTTLLATLDGLPFAIAQAGRFIQSLNVSPGSYLEIYDSERREVMELLSGEPDLQDANKGSIRTTWNLSLKLLKDKISQYGQSSNYFSAYRLLQLFAYFHPSDLSFETLRRGLVGNSVPPWFRIIFASKPRFFSVVRILIDLSLVDNNTTEGSYSMHRIVHDWLCLYVRNTHDTELLRLAVSAISFSAPLVLTTAWADEQGQLALHAVQALPRLDNFNPMDFLVRFGHFNSPDLELVATLLHGEPVKTWQLLKFDHAFLGLSNLLRSCGKESEACEILQRARSLMHVDNVRGDDEDEHQVVRALLDYSHHPNRTKEAKLLLMDDLCKRFEALGSYSWVIKARNIQALQLASMPGKQELAIQTWHSALAAARDLCGSVFFHPAFMVFVNLAGRLQRGVRPKALLALFESVELEAHKQVFLYPDPEAMWVLTSLRKMRAGNFELFIRY